MRLAASPGEISALATSCDGGASTREADHLAMKLRNEAQVRRVSVESRDKILGQRVEPAPRCTRLCQRPWQSDPRESHGSCLSV
jgi:hypothetical protein